MNNLAILFGLALAITGCAYQSSDLATDVQAGARPSLATANPGEPRIVTDLSQVSSSKPVPVPTPLPNVTDSTANAQQNPNAIIQQNIDRLFVSNINQLRYSEEGHSDAPGDTTLLNDKAREFSEFSYQLLNQTLAAARAIEPDRLAGRKLPEDLAPMMLTAVMDSQGRLTEISIESHSGDHQVDEIIIDSCKKGMWSRNPPPQALDANGVYRLRIKGDIRAYSFDLGGRYKYETELGLGIL